MAITPELLTTREGVLRFPNEAASILQGTSAGSTNAIITDEVLATRAGVLRFPTEAADYIQYILDNQMP